MKRNKSINKIILFYLIIPISIILLLYLLLPQILNYPPDSTDNKLQKDIDGLPYTRTICCNKYYMYNS